MLSDGEEEIYRSAIIQAENAIARSAEIQQGRKGERGEIKRMLFGDEFHELDDAIEELGEAITLLRLIDRAVAWTELNAECREIGAEDLIEVTQ